MAGDKALYVYAVFALCLVVFCVCCGASMQCVYRWIKKRHLLGRQGRQGRRADEAEAARAPSLAHRRHYYRSNTSTIFPRQALVLRNPVFLPNSVEYRLEAAFRDAKDGFHVCRVCEFENFKRFPFCSLCGTDLHNSVTSGRDGTRTSSCSTTDQASVPTKHRHAKKTARKNSKKYYGVSPPDTDDEERECGYEPMDDKTSQEVELVALHPQHTQRQTRARKRKEWTRKLDVNDRLFWYRDGSIPGVDPRFVGYALELRTRVPSSQVGPDAVAMDGTSSSSSSFTPVETITLDALNLLRFEEEESSRSSKFLEVEMVTQALSSEVESLSVELVGSALARPEHLPVDDGNRDALQWRDILQMASQDFPTKYAYFVATTASLLVDQEPITLSVVRMILLDDSVHYLSTIRRDQIRSVMRISFVDEPGVDAGGLYREWFVLVSQEISSPVNGVLRCVNTSDQTVYLNPNSCHDIGDNHLAYFYATGRLIGRALLEGYALSFHLALPLLKIVLGLPVSFSDMAYFDPEAHRSMLWIRENHGVDALGLDFSITEKRGDEMVVVDLVEDGRNIDVTDANKHLYLERRFRYALFESVSSQLYVFLKGVYEVIPQELLMLFDPEEFDYLLCGSDEIDVDDWVANTKCSDSLQDHTVLTWFWELVREMPNEYRRRLLHFATGSSRIPLAGFSALTSYDGRLCPFHLEGVSEQGSQYIASHACFNRLELPLFESRVQFKDVLYATLEMELNGFTTE